ASRTHFPISGALSSSRARATGSNRSGPIRSTPRSSSFCEPSDARTTDGLAVHTLHGVERTMLRSAPTGRSCGGVTAMNDLATAQVLRNLDERTSRIEQRLHSFPTREEMNEAIRVGVEPLATREELGAAIEPLATREDLRAAREPLAAREEIRPAVEPLAPREELRAAGEPLATREELRAAVAPLA